MGKKTLWLILSFFMALPPALTTSSLAAPAAEKGNEVVKNKYNSVLTPRYYQPGNDELKGEIDNFLSYATKVKFFHPLNDIKDELRTPIMGHLGSKKQLPGMSDHHHWAIDLHPTTTGVNLYAAHDGYLTRRKGPMEAMDSMSIIQDITDNDGKLLGKLATTYLHLDLDKDTAEIGALNNKYVNKGDLIGRNLNSETLGGPHLHFEIRYYRGGDSGTERFYGPGDARDAQFNLTLQSAGPWIYGYWNENTGYGYGFPVDHGLIIKSSMKPLTAPPYGRPEPKQEDIERGIVRNDVLTPKYYHPGNNELKHEIDNFLSHTKKVTLFHPLNDIKDKIEIPIDKRFGAGRGPTATETHNNGVDLVPIGTIPEIKIYAAHDGYLTAHADRFYHHYISIAKDIVDNDGKLLGKLITIYGNLDLDKDPADLIALQNQSIKKGKLISQNLYSQTWGRPPGGKKGFPPGGPPGGKKGPPPGGFPGGKKGPLPGGVPGGKNLHFEIRYYRSGDSGLEVFYGPDIPPFAQYNLTLSSAGPWSFGHWNENIGYGFGYAVFMN